MKKNKMFKAFWLGFKNAFNQINVENEFLYKEGEISRRVKEKIFFNRLKYIRSKTKL